MTNLFKRSDSAMWHNPPCECVKGTKGTILKKNHRGLLVCSQISFLLFLYIIDNIIYGLQFSPKKKKLPTYLLIVKNLSRVTANQQFFKDGLMRIGVHKIT